MYQYRNEKKILKISKKWWSSTADIGPTLKCAFYTERDSVRESKVFFARNCKLETYFCLEMGDLAHAIL